MGRAKLHNTPEEKKRAQHERYLKWKAKLDPEEYKKRRTLANAKFREENPEFNFEEVMEDAKAFKFGAFCSTIVSKVDVKQLSKQNSLQDIPHQV